MGTVYLDRKMRTKMLFLSTALAVCASSAAMAAEAAPAPATGPTAAQMGDIVVTASKRSQSVNKTSIAVTALTQDQLQNAGVVNIRDLSSAVPNVQVHTLGPSGYFGLTIRGISNQDFSQLGSPAVATYVDGVYISVPQFLSGGLYDLERMEVLRGPQGTTYGQNSTGGNVNIITADPKHSFSAAADLSYGNYNDVQAHAMINVPVTENLAIRAAGSLHRSDGFYDTLGTTTRNYGAEDNFGGRVSALWTPSSAFRWKLTLEGFDNQGTPSNMLLQMGKNGKPIDGRSPYSQPFNGPHPEPNIDLKSYSIRSRMDLKMSDSLTLAYVAGYQHQKSSYDFGILGAGGLEVYDGRWIDRVKAYSNELDLNFDQGRFHNILGVSQFAKTNPYLKAFHFRVFNADLLIPGDAKQTSFGIFDQATFDLFHNVRLIGGVRRSHETQNTGRDYDTITCAEMPGADRTFMQILSFSDSSPGCGAQTTPFARGAWNNISWKGGAEWDVNARTLAYFTVTNGFKSGEVQPGLPAGLPPSVTPEEVINYELGLKSRLLDNRLNIRIALYDMDYKNIQVNKVTAINNTPYVFSQNAGRARIYGTELELQYAPTDQDHISAFANYTHATYTDYHNAYNGQTSSTVPSLDGSFLPNAPEFTARVDYAHDFVLASGGKITPDVAVYYQTKNYLREFNLPIDRVGGYSKTDINLTYTDPTDRWTLTGFVTNLENRTIRESANNGVNDYFSDYLPPRLYGVRVSYKY